MAACPFCLPTLPERRIVRATDHTLTVLSDPRLLPGHTLVIPKRHIEEPWELREEELLAIFHEINRVRALLLDKAEGVDIRQNYRPFLPQGRTKVDHVRFHVLPRNNKDELYQQSMRYETALFTEPDPKELRIFTDLLSF